MSFPVDMLKRFSHEDLENLAEEYMSDLRSGNPDRSEVLYLPKHGKIPITLSTVGFVPLYGEEQTHKVLALFAPGDSLTAVALFLADQWWSIDDIVRTSAPARQGLHQVKSIGERVVLYVLNRIIYRTQEMERNEIPFLCHGKNDYAKILWKKGEAIGFYSVKLKGSFCSSYCHQNYKLPVLNTMFVRKRYRGKDFGLLMLEDFVDSFPEDSLGLRYPLSGVVKLSTCKRYLEKYPGDRNLLWEVEGVGHWFQRTSVTSVLQRENLKSAGEALQKKHKSLQTDNNLQQSAAVSEASGQKNTEVETQLSVNCICSLPFILFCFFTQDPNVASVSVRTRKSHLKRPRIGRNGQESEPPQGREENALHVSESRLELPVPRSESSEDLVKVPEVNSAEKDEEMVVENKGQSVSEAELHVSPPEKQSEKEETPPEALNGEVTEETGKTSPTSEEETANQVQSGEAKLQSENQGEEPLTLFVPLILESSAKPSEDTVSEKVLNANDPEVLTEENASAEKEGTEEQQNTENAAASASKEEPSDNGLPNSMVTEAAAEAVSENTLPKTASSLEDQNEEAGPNSQETSAALSQSGLIVVELEGVSFQQPSGQEGQKNQLEEHSEECEQMDQYTQTVVERVADSSSEEAEIEVPVVDRRNLRRKAKGYKGPPKKKGKPA
ncbi:Soluble lamin-associated protein of 75 kDa [Podiceps cristatus]|nr:Soluble lamin-associated protein of 75 kDa [Podiceps cristatus]